MTINCFIIDDEPPAISILQAFIKKVPYLNLVGTNTNAIEVLANFSAMDIDLLFLDIQMPDITGIEFLQALDKKPMVIFTTAYDQYAMQGYDLDVLDYLLKPIPFQRFLKAANKAHHYYKNSQPTTIEVSYLLVKSDYQTKKIAYEDILYIEGLKDYVKIYTTNGLEMTRLNLKGILAKLPAHKFIRIHRSYIVAFSKITAFQKNNLSIDKKILPIGDSYRANLFDKF